MSVYKEELGFPLFHGTSSIFLDSINQSGLGGENVSKKFEINAMFSQVVDAFNSKYKDCNWWVGEGFICEKMVRQEVTNGGFNFRYGGVYLTPSLKTAKNYATSNKYGSELISYFIRSYEELFKLDPMLADKIFPIAHPLRQLIALNPVPVVLEVVGITKDCLVTEQGMPIEEQLELMRQFPEELWQQFNFESTKPIFWENIKQIDLNG
ncbi:hypothetical protein CGJ31_23350 [Vibrio parahaemolyticus]|uniref:hypothetical protein n=1 Tax=Vibrio parahaemolyticus TaxID=670 RepID=UPI00111FF133|nr:hypothetical protein [Vibrio parahaemolyticus]TOF02350.1 hypothetical protein CGJ31_23350 [Vibrio parahaemolyticus]